FFWQWTAYRFSACLGGADMCIRVRITDLAELAPDCHAWPRPFTTDPVRYAIGLGGTPPTAAALTAVAERRLRGLAGVTLTRAEGGEVPTLR
ncbi:hypothetical protein, partial [Streptomyces sp. MB09-02B]|uniref:hypothetical protein n=1 Tax=Streptomyces sp. MB09-02B TaxID=3028667 RepID=UPI0029A945FB